MKKSLVKQIKTNSLNQFRNWKGAGGIGTVQSFGGGTSHLSGYYGAYFHPFDDIFQNFDKNVFVRKYNSFINKLTKYFSFFSFFP